MKLHPLFGAAAVFVATAGNLIAEFRSGVNLLTNGSATSPLATGWTVITAGGNGWSNTSSGGYDADGGYFITSYALCQRSQTIDLLAKGYTAAELDAGTPILVSEAISEYYQNSAADTYYIKVELRDAAGAVIDKWEVGSSTALKAATTAWTVESHEFRNYGPGVRSIYFEDGGKDGGFWAQFYGTYHDAATVQFVDAPPTDIALTPPTIGEGTPPGGIVGYLTATDADDSTHTFTLEPEVTTVTTPLLTQGAAGWRYLDGIAAPASDWTGPTFNDSAWSTGAAPLGYDSTNADAWLITKLNYGADTNNKPVTTYFRKAFDVADPAAITALTCTLQVDDGCVAYLNGHELFRDGVAEGITVLNTTLANRSVSGGDENDFDPVTITGDKLAFLQPGTNVLAVEVHQAALNSSDITLDINLSASSTSTANRYSNDLFEIVGTELRLKNGSTGLFPGDYTVRVKATDHAGVSVTKLVTVQRINASYVYAPTDITLAPSTVNENAPAGTLIGNLTAIDADSGQAERFELTAGEGDADNSRVSLSGSRLYVAAPPDYETKPTLQIRVKVTDSTGISFSKALSIAVINNTTEDQDGDGLTEAEEDLNGNGAVDAGETSPLLADSDGDGFNDFVEHQAGSNPANAGSIPVVVEVKQLTTHITGDSWLTAVSWDGGQVPGPSAMAVSDGLVAAAITFRPPPTADPVFPGVGVDLRNGAIFRLKHTGLCRIGRIILRDATMQQGMTTSVSVGGGGSILEVPETISTGPDGTIDTAAVPLDLRASLSGAGTIKVTGTTAGQLRLLAPSVSFTGELSLENPEVVIVDPAAALGAHRIDVKAGTLRAEANTSLPGTAVEVSATGKLVLAHTLTVGTAVLGGVSIPNGSYSSAALITLGVPATAIVNSGGTLVVGTALPNADSDGDGVSDAMEALAQTDPLNAADFLHISSVTDAGNGAFHLQWKAVPGVIYTVQYTTDTAGAWQDVTNVAPATAAGVYDIPLTAPLPAKAFFRLAVKTP